MACTLFISSETQPRNSYPKHPMKNLYTKNKIHPSPPPPPISAHLALLPATILTLTTALSPQDREVLAYLISCSTSDFSELHHHNIRKTTKPGNDNGSNNITTRSLDHGKTFGCDCFKCYMSFWVLWDTSPNRELIHEIIEAYEDDLYCKENKKKKSVKVKKQKKSSKVYDCTAEEPEKIEVSQPDIKNDVIGDEMKMETEKGSSTMRQVFSLIGEKIWGAWSKQ